MKGISDMRATHELYKYALAVLLALAGGANVWGQVMVNVPIESVEILNGQNEEYAIDGNTNISGNDYCLIRGRNNQRTGTMTLILTEASDIDQVVVWLGRNSRPSSITVSTSSNGSNYNQAVGFVNNFSCFHLFLCNLSNFPLLFLYTLSILQKNISSFFTEGLSSPF